MRDSDWSREILLRSDWSGLIGATYTTDVGLSVGISVTVSVPLFVLKTLFR